MNFNASVYANGVPLLTEKFGISEQAARVGQMIFLIAYAFGCELWAPWSEELGRWPVLQVSLCLVNSTSTFGRGALAGRPTRGLMLCQSGSFRRPLRPTSQPSSLPDSWVVSRPQADPSPLAWVRVAPSHATVHRSDTFR